MDDRRSPGLVNTMYIPQDVNEENGGTLIIPGSHRALIEADGSISELPPTINLEAKAARLCCSMGACCTAPALTDPPTKVCCHHEQRKALVRTRKIGCYP